MKDITNISIKFKSPHLYKEDLIKIEENLLALNPKIYKIQINTTEYDNLSEIEEKTSENFIIQTSSPYIRLELSRFNSILYSPEEDLKTELASRVGEQALEFRNPNKLGKDKATWRACYDSIELAVLRRNI